MLTLYQQVLARNFFYEIVQHSLYWQKYPPPPNIVPHTEINSQEVLQYLEHLQLLHELTFLYFCVSCQLSPSALAK